MTDDQTAPHTLDGLKGLAAIEDFATSGFPIPRGTPDRDGLDWVGIEHAYQNSAYIARFMDDHGLTAVMRLRLSMSE
jgi:hypothetical protein